MFYLRHIVPITSCSEVKYVLEKVRNTSNCWTCWLCIITRLGGGSLVVDSLVFVPYIVCGGYVFGPCFVMDYVVSFLVLQSSWRERERAGCFPLIVCLMPCDCWWVGRWCAVCVLGINWSYSLTLWGAVCDCGIYWSYSLTLWYAVCDCGIY